MYVANGPVSPNVADLTGSVTGGVSPVTSTWSASSPTAGAAAPSIADPGAVNTSATFSSPGNYELTLTATDSDSPHETGSATTPITVCPDVYVITAQGIAQATAAGRQVNNFANAFQSKWDSEYPNAKNGLVIQPLDYTSYEGGNGLPGLIFASARQFFNGILKNFVIVNSRHGRYYTLPESEAPDAYTQTFENGMSLLETLLESDQSNCPKTKEVLAGFSEGAAVIQETYIDLQDDPAVSQVASIYLYGDPLGTADGPGLLEDSPFTPFPSHPTGSSGTSTISNGPPMISNDCKPLDIVCMGVPAPPAFLPQPFFGELLIAIVKVGQDVHNDGYLADLASDGSSAASSLF